MEHYDGRGHVNVGTGVDLAIAELADMVRSVVYPEAEIAFDTSKPDGMPRKLLDVGETAGARVGRRAYRCTTGSVRRTSGSSRTRTSRAASRPPWSEREASAPVPPISGISIVIPAYDAASTIVESVASGLAAAEDLDGTDVEIVVVDDGSSDDTAQVVASEFAHEPRVRLHRHRQNRGGAATRNTAVEHAAHAWLFCLDSDNLVDPVSLRRMVTMAGSGDWDIVAPGEDALLP